VTGVLWYQARAGVYTANNYNGFGLYKFSGATGTLIASTTTDTALLKGSTGFKFKAFTSPSIVTTGAYVVALIYSNSVQPTAPTIGAVDVTASQPNLTAYNLTNNAKFSGFRNTVTVRPNPLMWSNVTQDATPVICPWFALY